MAEYLVQALSYFASLETLIALAIGVMGGLIIGIIPGLGPSVGIALLLPISFSMNPVPALVMMTSMYATGVYGGSITAVLCHTPGTAASAATASDGYWMTKNGRGMEAISIVTVASVVGGIIGSLGLIGYLMKLFGFEPAPLVLGVVLADILESNFRRALILAAPKGGLWVYFLSRPISIIIVLIILAFALVPVISKNIQKKSAAKETT